MRAGSIPVSPAKAVALQRRPLVIHLLLTCDRFPVLS